MEYTNLGRTGLKVSRLCLGTMNFGSFTTAEDGHAIMDRALEHGINFFDTANSYPSIDNAGGTEQIIGDWFGKGGVRRDKVVLATKVYGPVVKELKGWPNNGGLSARHIVQACEASLRRLNTEWIDLYQMHHVDRSVPWDEIWQAMDLLVAQGKVRYIGSSNFAGWHLTAAQAAAAKRNSLGVVSEQCMYNLLTRYVELEVLPAAIEHGIGIIPWSPLHRGLLGGVLRKMRDSDVGRSGQEWVQASIGEHRSALESYEKLCADLGADPAAVGLAWLLSRKGVTAPIIGPRKMAHLDDSLQALEVQLSDETLSTLDELFPPVGKGGPAPEAWAW